jgi:hypothetical protein
VRASRWVAIAALVVSVSGCGSEQSNWTFDNDSSGSPPKDAEVLSGTWEVSSESEAPTAPNALCQFAEGESPALTLGEATYADFVLSASFKPISGRKAQAAGLIFRVQDIDGYYVVRVDALEDEVAIYKYSGGRRSELQSESAKIASEEWQELRVEVTGGRIRGFLGDKPVVETTDEQYSEGAVGLWTEADSVTCFDDVQIRTT